MSEIGNDGDGDGDDHDEDDGDGDGDGEEDRLIRIEPYIINRQINLDKSAILILT